MAKSGGPAIAGVMAMRPDVLIPDEAHRGAGPTGSDTILGQISEYQQENGSTVVLLSHSMEDIAKTAKRCW